MSGSFKRRIDSEEDCGEEGFTMDTRDGSGWPKPCDRETREDSNRYKTHNTIRSGPAVMNNQTNLTCNINPILDQSPRYFYSKQPKQNVPEQLLTHRKQPKRGAHRRLHSLWRPAARHSMHRHLWLHEQRVSCHDRGVDGHPGYLRTSAKC